MAKRVDRATVSSSRYEGKGRTRFQVMLTDAELAQVGEAASKDGMPDDRSRWMREAALEKAEGRTVALPPAMMAVLRKRAREVGTDVPSLVIAWVTARLEG